MGVQQRAEIVLVRRHAELTGEMVEMMYHCTAEDTCPVELIAHGLPHRVLHEHNDK